MGIHTGVSEWVFTHIVWTGIGEVWGMHMPYVVEVYLHRLDTRTRQ